LGRLPVDEAETATALMTRWPEILSIKLGRPVPEPDGVPQAAVEYVESALLERGWRLAHPAVRGVLRDRDGYTVDVRTLTVGELTDLLRPALAVRARP